MNRRQLIFVVVLNALISLVVALVVTWAVEARRPDAEALAIVATPAAQTLVQPTIAQTNPNDTPEVTPTVAEEVVAENVDAVAEPTATLDPANQQIYVVVAGDSISSIANRFGITLDEIVRANSITDPNVVNVGTRLIIPVAADGNNAAPPAEPTTPPLVVGEGMVIRVVDAPGNIGTEAVQIVNDSNSVVNLNGWRLERENGPAYTFGELSIFPGSNIWVHTTSGTDTSIALYWNQTEAVWQSGSVARLIDGQSNVIHNYPVP